ncbi:MAG: wax ester/triacylglycerol synthase family O-acyltransferase [Betaproteobacteria bacterium]
MIQRLSGLDALFLFLETPEMPMHVGALHVYELPPSQRGRFVDRLRRHLAARLPWMAPLRRRLRPMPLDLDNPVWLDARPDLRRHIVEVRLPAGSGQAQLEAQVAALHAQRLDRRRPLWKFHVIEGLAAGPRGERRVGLYLQIHHAAVDGQAAVALLQALLDPSARPRRLRAPPRPRPAVEAGPDITELIGGALGHQLQQAGHWLKALPSVVRALSGAAARALGGSKGPRAGRLTLAPRTPLNASVTTERVFAGVTLPIAALKVAARAHDATLNDIVLWLCSTALRSHFAAQHTLPRKSLIAAVPISLRASGDTRANNQASITLVSLGSNLADDARRLAHIRAATASMKTTVSGVKSLLPTDFPSIGVPWLLQAGSALYGRAHAAERLPPIANVTISNVPGPPAPLYLAGARLLHVFPTSIVVHGVALNVTVQSYDESLDFGMVACAQAMPDIGTFADGLRAAFVRLQQLPAAKAAMRSPRHSGRGMVRAATPTR